MPDPKKGETQTAFVTRYVRSPHARKRFAKRKQRAAVAYSEYRAGPS